MGIDQNASEMFWSFEVLGTLWIAGKPGRSRQPQTGGEGSFLWRGPMGCGVVVPAQKTAAALAH